MNFARADNSVMARWWWTVDKWLLVALALLIGMGAVMIMAASPAVASRVGLDSFHFVRKQLQILPVAALILIGVWAVSAAAGLGLYHWWYTALDKTVPVAGILGYLIACMVASLLISLVPDRPRVTALAIVLMAAPLASTAAAAILHGAYYFEWIARPAIG